MNFKTEEYSMLFNRGRADEMMSATGFDAVVATSRENVEYISGHRNPTHDLMKNALVLAAYTPAATSPVFSIIPTLEVDTFLASKSWVEDVYLVGLFSRAPVADANMDEAGRAAKRLVESANTATNAITALVEALTKRGLANGRIALDESGISPNDWNLIVAALPNATISPGNGLLWNIRTVKTEEEINRLRTASRITEAAVTAALRRVASGSTDLDLARDYNTAIIAAGGVPTFAMFGSGTATAQPHLLTADRRISDDDLIRWDVGCTYGSYHSDTARAVVFGEPNECQAKVWDLLAAGVEGALALIRPGATPADLHTAAISPLSKSGLPNFARFHCGHGIGISIYDPPIVTNDDPAKSVFRMPGAAGGLLPGMVLNIEVGYYQQGLQGFLCEDTVLVTETGCERFTVAPKDLRLADYLSRTTV